jgi:hypothetical protein
VVCVDVDDEEVGQSFEMGALVAHGNGAGLELFLDAAGRAQDLAWACISHEGTGKEGTTSWGDERHTKVVLSHPPNGEKKSY